MYTIWFRQYLLASQASVDLLSNVYVEWSKGIAQLASIGCGLAVSDEHFDEGWIDSVLHSAGFGRRRPHVANCAAGIYSRHDFDLSGSAANADHWIECLYEVEPG